MVIEIRQVNLSIHIFGCHRALITLRIDKTIKTMNVKLATSANDQNLFMSYKFTFNTDITYALR